jgi:hypothetical protein
MSYDPSQAQGARAVQIDVDGATVLSDDITAHSKTTFNSRNKYFIDTMYYPTMVSSVSSLIFYKNWTGFSWAGGSIRGNIAATTTSVTDEAFIGSNTPRSSLAMQTTTSGGGSLASDKVFTSLWRIE